MNFIISGSIYALASIGLCLSYGILRILNFAHGHLLMIGAYLYFFASVEMGWGMAWSLVFTGIAMLVLALISMKVFITPFMRYSPVLTFISTLSLATILESVVSLWFGVNVKSLDNDLGAESYEFLGAFVTPVQMVTIASSIILLVALAFVVHHTSFGRSIRAVSEGSEFAEGLGVSKRWVVGVVFSITMLLNAYAGILVGYETNLQPVMGNAYTMKAFAAVLLGGGGSVWGTIFGAYFLGFIENFSIGLDFGSFSIPAGYKDAIALVMILLVLLVRPQGVFGRKRRVI